VYLSAQLWQEAWSSLSWAKSKIISPKQKEHKGLEVLLKWFYQNHQLWILNDLLKNYLSVIVAYKIHIIVASRKQYFLELKFPQSSWWT
jgi:hypothetical protein